MLLQEVTGENEEAGTALPSKVSWLICDVFIITFTLCWLITVDVTVLKVTRSIFCSSALRNIMDGSPAPTQETPCMYCDTQTGLLELIH